MNAEEKIKLAKLNEKWMAGQKVEELQFQFNTIVEVNLPDRTVRSGWIVGAALTSPEPTYTVECSDGSGDIKCPESSIKKATG